MHFIQIDGDIDNIDDDGDNYPALKMPEPFKTVIDDQHPQVGLWSPNSEHYLKYWPDIDLPISVVITCNQWHYATMDSYYGTEHIGWDPCPSIILTMENGATLEVIYNDPVESGMDEEVFSGDWDVYLSQSAMPEKEVRYSIIDVVNEAYSVQEEELKELNP